MTDEPLILISTSTATTYNFRAAESGRFGWACCTVNDSTGELAITSDWGNYAHRWNVNHLGTDDHGVKTTLTSFLAGGSIEYIADKLTSREQRDRFDAEATVKEFRDLLRARRRESKSLYAGLSRPSWSGPRDGELDKVTARRLWDAIESVAIDAKNTRNGGDWFVDRYFSSRDMEGAALVCNEPWDLIRTKPSGEYLALIKIVLPALVEACRTADLRRVAPGLAEVLDRPIPRHG
jgi:hypothetical protein